MEYTPLEIQAVIEVNHRQLIAVNQELKRLLKDTEKENDHARNSSSTSPRRA